MDYHEILYNNLMTLVNDNEAFYYADQYNDGVWYRIFNYRLTSYEDFLKPGATECRGIMFEVESDDHDAKMIRLASMTMEKFWNLNENPFTMDLDMSNVKDIELKADGSLISTYIHYSGSHTPQLRLKSKGSLFSDQAVAAMNYLDHNSANFNFARQLLTLAMRDYTVNMEWCAPDNRIVIGYMEPQLTVLNVRNNEYGEYVERSWLASYGSEFSEVVERWTERLNVENPAHFVANIPQMEGVEGYVVRLNTGQRVKVKTEWYLVQHRAKDSINSPRRLFEAVLAEATDDLRSLFHDDPLVIQKIADMEKFVEEKYNHMVDTVERFYQRNKDLERKEYAILGQKELIRMHFGLAMDLYIGRTVNYKEFMAKRWKEFGLKDEVKDEG